MSDITERIKKMTAHTYGTWNRQKGWSTPLLITDAEGVYFYDNTGNLIHKWVHYFDIYDRHFSRFRNKEVIIVEFGVFQGGSLDMWKDYFGPGAKIYGIDINPACKQFEGDQITILIGDQEDREFLHSLRETIPTIDILIDDGGHKMKQQIATYEELFDHIDENGVYLCEDLLTSYRRKWGGGYLRKGSFIEYSKHFIDKINAWHSRDKRLVVDSFTRSVDSLHYYDNVLVIEKRPIEEPHHEMTGTAKISDFKSHKSLLRKMVRLFKKNGND